MQNVCQLALLSSPTIRLYFKKFASSEVERERWDIVGDFDIAEGYSLITKG
jgi:hypothetical protein